jgi:hypothetical protein
MVCSDGLIFAQSFACNGRNGMNIPSFEVLRRGNPFRRLTVFVLLPRQKLLAFGSAIS